MCLRPNVVGAVGQSARQPALDKLAHESYGRSVADTGHKRAHRVAHLIQESLARLLVEGLKDPRVGFVTVTEVRLTDDLRQAQVFVSIFGDDTKRQSTLAGLRAAQGYLRRELGHGLQLRVVPELLFVHDDSLDRAQRLQTVLNAAKRGDLDVPAPEDLEALPEAHTARSGVFEAPPVLHAPQQNRPNKRPSRKSTGTAAARRGSGRTGGQNRRRRALLAPRLDL